MPFTEDLTAFLADADFATAAVFSGNGATVNVIFDDDYVEPLTMEATGPHAIGDPADFPSIVNGQTLTINAVVYTIINPQPIKGMLHMKLRET